MKDILGKEIGEAFVHAINAICEKNPGNLNSLLQPTLMDYSENPMTSTMRYEVKEWELNQRGQVHGGAVSAMFDVAMGVSAAVFSHSDVTTAEMTVSYIRPFVGDAFDFRTNIVHLGSKLARIECKAFSVETGKLMATSHATYAYIG